MYIKKIVSLVMNLTKLQIHCIPLATNYRAIYYSYLSPEFENGNFLKIYLIILTNNTDEILLKKINIWLIHYGIHDFLLHKCFINKYAYSCKAIIFYILQKNYNFFLCSYHLR